jgi:hypothetical protein
LDRGLAIRGNQLFDADGKLIVALPSSYAGWAGYKETAPMCRVTGHLGAVTGNSTVLIRYMEDIYKIIGFDHR